MAINWPRRPFSLGLRLTFFISLAAIITFAAFASIVLHSVEAHFAEQDVENLQQVSHTLAKVLEDPAISPTQKNAHMALILASTPQISALVSNTKQQVIFRTPQGPDLMPLLFHPEATAPQGAESSFLWSASQQTSHHGPAGPNAYRVIITTLEYPNSDAEAYRLVAALSIDFHLHYLADLRHHLLVISGVMSLAIFFIVLFAVYKGHQPLRDLSLTIKNMTSENLDLRLDPRAVPIELEQLIISFNHMIARIEDVFTRQANFSADIAHEMRTPITNLVTQTEIALCKPRALHELEEVLYSNLEEYQRMAKMVSDMLFLAQADNNQLIPERLAVCLYNETTTLFEYYDALAEERGITLCLSGIPGWVTGDPLMLRRVLNNLLSNAVRYTPDGESIAVTIVQEGPWVALTVENTGNQIDADHLPHLFERFYRVDPARQRKGQGSGIGLAIVKSIIEAHQGKISVASDAQSTRFTLRLSPANEV